MSCNRADTATPYRGRFAPSPSGPLHFGSLVAALGSWVDARSHQGEWLVRMEDLDPPREKPGAADRILRTLEAFGLTWDGPVLYQSRRRTAYAAALEVLRSLGATYPCSCSRKKIQAVARQGEEGAIYPGTCREAPRRSCRRPAIRIRTSEQPIRFVDRRLGPVERRLASEFGDFILRRADGLFAYQLAVVIDDAEQRINQVVRGEDLLLSTPRQRYLQQLLKLPPPAWLHLPLVVDPAGRKLSKQSGAYPVDPAHPLRGLIAAWHFLGQAIPERDLVTPEEFLQWAVGSWSVERLPGRVVEGTEPSHR